MADAKSGRGAAASTRSGSKNKSSKNETPNTPDVAESKIARMKVDELRKRLKQRGVEDTGKLRKDDLVRKLIKLERAGGGSAAGKSSGPKKTISAKQSRNETPNTPDIEESKIARMKVDELRKRLKQRGVGETGKLRKDDLVRKMIATLRSDSKKTATAKSATGKSAAGKSATGKSAAGKSATGKSAAGKSATGKSATGKSATGKASAGSRKSGGIRTGKNTSPSLKYSQEITSPDDRPERDGRSLVTTDHQVIRRWAEARDAVPATIDGTEHGDHLGVLRFDFPGGASGSPLRQIEWDEWFDTFDKRRLNFIYQQKRSDGRQSNFFQLESPDREDG